MIYNQSISLTRLTNSLSKEKKSLCKTKQNKPKQNKTNQNKPKQTKIKQNKTRG
jgi:hypothetical protein